jgi:hypothetical protein
MIKTIMLYVFWVGGIIWGIVTKDWVYTGIMVTAFIAGGYWRYRYPKG